MKSLSIYYPDAFRKVVGMISKKQMCLRFAMMLIAATGVLLYKRSLFTKEVRVSIMPKVRSLDIDGEVDFIVCEQQFPTIL